MFSNSSDKKQNNNVKFSPKHGGALTAAAEFFDIPVTDWLDLSTGINPESWPVPNIPSWVWQRLPEQSSEVLSGKSLESTALTYYLNGAIGQNRSAESEISDCPTVNNILSSAGSQQAIRLLPLLFNSMQKHAKQGAIIHTEAKVWVTAGSFSEHGLAWEEQGHRVGRVACDRISQLLAQQPVDVLILVNPDNPSGYRWQPEQLLKWWSILRRRGGWLIVDEAFMDMTANQSLTPYVEREGLFVLRSVGKFFGLAGVRLGFMFASQKSIACAKKMLGPWSLSHPAQYVGAQALQDFEWIELQKQLLTQQAERLTLLLKKYIPYQSFGTDLFRTIYFNDADRVFQALAKLGILVRYLPVTPKSQHAIRLGLPANDEQQWQRLENALANIMSKK